MGRPRAESDSKYRYAEKDKDAPPDPHFRPINKTWDKYDTKFMTDMRKVDIRPTRVGETCTLGFLDLKEDAVKMFETIGLDQFWNLRKPTYPKYVREFIATIRVTYKDPDNPNPNEGHLNFFLNKKRYKVSINKFCDVYGFAHGDDDLIEFPDFPHPQKFWNLIGDSGPFKPREAKIAYIRNPVLRIVAKIIGNTFFFKAESGAVTKSELWLLFLGVRHLLDGYDDVEIPSVNYGALLGDLFMEIKKTAYKKSSLHLGTILTPLFEYVLPNMDNADTIEDMPCVDNAYLESCQIIKMRWTYAFQDRDGIIRYVKLPNKSLTALTSEASLVFLPGPEHLVPNPYGESGRAPRRRAASVRRAQPQQDDPPHEDPVYAPPDFPATDSDEFVLSELPAGSDTLARQDWLIESTSTNNSLMRKILSIVSCYRPPSTSARRPTEQTRVETADTAPHNNVAGPTNTQPTHSSEEDTEDGRLERCRSNRQIGRTQDSRESPARHD